MSASSGVILVLHKFPLQSHFKYCSTKPYFITLLLTHQATKFTPTKMLFILLYLFESPLGNILWYMIPCKLFLKHNLSLRLFASFSLFFLVPQFALDFWNYCLSPGNIKLPSLFLNLQCFSKPSKINVKTQFKGVFY